MWGERIAWIWSVDRDLVGLVHGHRSSYRCRISALPPFAGTCPCGGRSPCRHQAALLLAAEQDPPRVRPLLPTLVSALGVSPEQAERLVPWFLEEDPLDLLARRPTADRPEPAPDAPLSPEETVDRLRRELARLPLQREAEPLLQSLTALLERIPPESLPPPLVLELAGHLFGPDRGLGDALAQAVGRVTPPGLQEAVWLRGERMLLEAEEAVQGGIGDGAAARFRQGHLLRLLEPLAASFGKEAAYRALLVRFSEAWGRSALLTHLLWRQGETGEAARFAQEALAHLPTGEAAAFLRFLEEQGPRFDPDLVRTLLPGASREEVTPDRSRRKGRRGRASRSEAP